MSTWLCGHRCDLRRLLAFVSSVACVFFAISLGGCRRSEPDSGSAPRETKLVVFAAASLREVFTTLSDDFKRKRPDALLMFNFAGTQELRMQLEQGALVDVFASADQRHMQELQKAALVSAPKIFAQNEPVLVVARERSATLSKLADLPSANRIVIGAPEVPIGRYTLQILDRATGTLGADFRARVEAKVASRELNVRQVLSKVSLGEADAGFVYRTDALAAEGVGVITLPPDINVSADYPIAVVASAPHRELAESWVEFVLSPEGQRVLESAGFVSPAERSRTP